MSETIYFSVEPFQYAGFTDQLIQFHAMYKLGAALGYRYVHRPFGSSRTSFLPVPWGKYHLFLSFLTRPGQRISRFIARNMKSSRFLYELLDVDRDATFQAEGMPGDRNAVRIVIDNDIDGIEAADSFDDIRAVIQGYIRQAAGESRDYLVFCMPTMARAVRPVQRINRFIPWGEGTFPRIKFKSGMPLAGQGKSFIVHMRLGDTALIKTPWNSFIPLWPKGEGRYREYHSLADIKNSRAMYSGEFLDFAGPAINTLHALGYTGTIHSDGYTRTLVNLVDNAKRLKLGVMRKIRLAEHLLAQDVELREQCAGLPGCEVFIGESLDNLHSMLDNLMTADVVITSGHQSMVPKFLSVYRSGKNMPLLIVLYRHKKPSYNWHGIDVDTESVIYFDIDRAAPEFVASRIEQALS